MHFFTDRSHAGRQLGQALQSLAHEPDLLVLGLPRGGVPVAFEVAKALRAPLDVFIVRKLGVPGHEELAMGAIASGGAKVFNTDIIGDLGISGREIDAAVSREEKELARRETAYRMGADPEKITGKLIIVVDDGLATGATMRVAIQALRQRRPRGVVIAIPVAPPSSLKQLKDEADKVICLYNPEPFHGVGLWYRNFSQTSDGEVMDLLKRARARFPAKRRSSVCDWAVLSEESLVFRTWRGLGLRNYEA